MRCQLKALLLAACLVLDATMIFAQTDTTWTGTNGVWSDASKWSNGVPIGEFNAIISGTAGNITQDLPVLDISGLEIDGEFANLDLDEEITITEAFIWNGSTISGNEAINVLDQGMIQNGRLDTTLNNFGSIAFLQGTIVSSIGVTTGAWNNQPGSSAVFVESAVFGSSANQIGTFNNADGATIHQLAPATYMIWNVVNDGLIQIENNSQILFVNDYVQHPTGKLHLKGANSVVDMFGFALIEGRIEGDGALISTIELDGVIAPGQPNPLDPIGSLEIFGGLMMTPDSILEFDIGANVDSIAVSHNLILDGTIHLTAREGLVPGVYTLMTATQQLVPGGLKLGPLPKGVEASLVIDEINREVNLDVISVATPVEVDSIDVTKGLISSGSVGELGESDDQYLVLDPEFLTFRYQLECTVNATSSTDSPSGLEFSYESRGFSFVGTVEQEIELFNYDTVQFETVDSGLATATDTVICINPTGDPARFVQSGTGAMQARIRYQNSLPFWVFDTQNLYLPYRVRVDQIFWSVTQ